MISHRVVHESHIAPGNYVQIISRRDIHRTGYVTEIVGSMVRIHETSGSRHTPIQSSTVAAAISVTQDVSFISYILSLLMSVKFLANINHVEVVRSGYHTEPLLPELRRWHSKSVFKLDDFVRVLKGDRVGQEGIITHLLEGYRVEVYVTANHLDLSFKLELADNITESGERLDDLQSNAERFEVSVWDLYVGDHVGMYDRVQVQCGKQTLTGVICTKRPFGYVHVADTPEADDKASSYQVFMPKSYSLSLVLNECLSCIHLDC